MTDLTEPAPNSSETSIAWLWACPGLVRSAVMFTPVLLSIVAITQFVRAYTLDQSPWKGGGFGMFSTYDLPENRRIRVLLVTDERDIEVPVNRSSLKANDDLFDHFLRTMTVPTHDNLQWAADELSRFTWWMPGEGAELSRVASAIRASQTEPSERATISLSALRDVNESLRKAAHTSAAESVPSESAATASQTTHWPIEPPYGIAPASILESVQTTSPEHDGAHSDSGGKSNSKNDQDPPTRLTVKRIRVELWKGEFDQRTTRYTFRLWKTAMADIAGTDSRLDGRAE